MYHIRYYAWASALLVLIEWAIARALMCETSNNTDSHAFSFLCLKAIVFQNYLATSGESIGQGEHEMNSMCYRPVWTTGRYNKEKNVAIMYNLIAGFSYFFEDYSAQLIGRILEIPRNKCVEVEQIAEELNFAMESLEPFMQELEGIGLVSSVLPTEEIIADYRRRVSEYNCTTTQTIERTIKEKLPYDVSNAEMEYAKAVGSVTSAMFELTYNCSEKCIHCYNEGATRNDEETSHRGNRKELSLEEYKRLIDELYDQGLTKVCLSGGDPFSKPIAWDIIDYLYNKGIAFDIFTNGQRIVKDVKRLADYFPRLVGVSIYSGVAKDHDFITRIKGSWEKSMDVVRQLSQLGVPMNIKCCIMRPNVKSYYLVADIARQYGAIPQFEVSVTDSVEGDKCVSHYLRLTPEQLDIVLHDDNVPLYVGKEAPNYGGQKKLLDDTLCGGGDNSICVTPEGNIIPCCAFHTKFGNIREQSVAEILQSKERKWWLSVKLNEYEECGKHDYCDYCNLCPGCNFAEHGTPLKAAENNCYIAKQRHSLAKRMMEGYDPFAGKSLKEALQQLDDYKPEIPRREQSQNHSNKRLKVGG